MPGKKTIVIAFAVTFLLIAVIFSLRIGLTVEELTSPAAFSNRLIPQLEPFASLSLHLSPEEALEQLGRNPKKYLPDDGSEVREVTIPLKLRIYGFWGYDWAAVLHFTEHGYSRTEIHGSKAGYSLEDADGVAKFMFEAFHGRFPHLQCSTSQPGAAYPVFPMLTKLGDSEVISWQHKGVSLLSLRVTYQADAESGEPVFSFALSFSRSFQTLPNNHWRSFV